jgi:pyruvate formate lyase activating enzyme
MLPVTEELTGTVLEIQRMSTEDGPGIRTTVFMKGCPMHCLWCHNPESISPLPQPQWIGSRCIGCKTCLDACSNGALSMQDIGIVIDRERCEGCGACAEACPTTALELMGRRWGVRELAYELLKDREYFTQSGGGITISGGEATLQWPFVAALLFELKNAGVHTAIDTCGITSQQTLEALLPYADLVLYDLKEMESQRHRAYTGAPLKRVLETLEFICTRSRAYGTPPEVWLRTPLIPGATARVENVTQIGKHIAAHCRGVVTRWDLLAFNNLCKDKYLRLGQSWTYQNTPLLAREDVEQLADAARNSGVDERIVYWSGTTRLEE